MSLDYSVDSNDRAGSIFAIFGIYIYLQCPRFPNTRHHKCWRLVFHMAVHVVNGYGIVVSFHYFPVYNREVVFVRIVWDSHVVYFLDLLSGNFDMVGIFGSPIFSAAFMEMVQDCSSLLAVVASNSVYCLFLYSSNTRSHTWFPSM